MKILVIASAISLVLHSLVLCSISRSKKIIISSNPPLSSTRILRSKKLEFLPKSEVSSRAIEMSSVSKEVLALIKKRSQRTSPKTCKDDKSYIGIGIVHDGWDDTIIDLAPGYAAERAGIVHGDRVIGFWDEFNTYHQGVNGISKKEALGTKIALCINRMGMTLIIPIIREKICNK